MRQCVCVCVCLCALSEQLPSDLVSTIALAIREQVKTAHQKISRTEDAGILKVNSGVQHMGE